MPPVEDFVPKEAGVDAKAEEAAAPEQTAKVEVDDQLPTPQIVAIDEVCPGASEHNLFTLTLSVRTLTVSSR